MNRKDFAEVSHTGGKVTFTIRQTEDGHLTYQIGYSLSSPNPSALVGVYAHPEGFACGNIKMGGIGDPWNPPPFPSCIAVLMASDSQGKYGHDCPQCKKHFRSESIPAHIPLTCPYCGFYAESFHFLTPAQNAYIKHYIRTLHDGIENSKPGTETEVIIDMDQVADSVTDDSHPDFYYKSVAQQTEFKCAKCNSYNDIRGKYGYCSSCAWRNNATYLKNELAELRERLNRKAVQPEEAVKQAVSYFDSAARDLAKELSGRVPMKRNRRNELTALLFHNLDKFVEIIDRFFGINLLYKMDSDRDFLRDMFLRRHVFEHNACVATERYVKEGSDSQIEVGVLIREQAENVHRLVGCLNRMFENFEQDFHEMLPPEEYMINLEEQRQKRIAEHKIRR